MASTYPGATDALPLPTFTGTLGGTTPTHSVLITNLRDAIRAVEIELGLDPAGTAATVRARLEAFEGQKGVASGLASLDSSAFVPFSQLRTTQAAAPSSLVQTDTNGRIAAADPTGVELDEVVTVGYLESVNQFFDLSVGADFVRSNTAATGTAALIPGMSINATAGSVWVMSGEFLYDASQTADVQFVVKVPTGSACYGRMTGVTPASSGTSGTHESIPIRTTPTSVLGASFAGTGVGTIMVMTLDVRIEAAAAATIEVRFAQAVAEVSNATLRQGSWLNAARLA